jgi:NAD(P)-dependent dehydrogenase (short-subunit alcohol dehydrogenase family)
MFTPDLLSGRVALVTGASSGLGRHFAQRLAQHGATVVIAARRVDALAALADELAAQGATAHAVALDVREPASVERAVADSVARAGRIDVLINNAGVALTKPALLTTDADWRSVIDTNLDGAFRVARAVAQAMADARRGGSIVNIASILALRVAKQLPAYVAAKAGLLKLTEALALEWAPQAIRVNALAPGYIETELNRDFLRSPAGESLGKRVALRRFGQPADLDGALMLLASDAGRYMTGATLVVDGGHSLAWL